MPDIVQPVPGEPGVLRVMATGEKIKLVEWREDSFYDTVQIDALTPTAGSSYEYFRDLTNKFITHTNLKTVRRIPSTSELIITRIGAVPNQALGNTLITDDDYVKLTYAATIRFAIGDRLIMEGPLWKYQSGYGVTGSTTRNLTGMVTNGVASAAAAPNLLVAQSVTDKDDLNGTLDFKSNAWINGGALMPTFTFRAGVTLDLHGLIKKPQGQ